MREILKFTTLVALVSVTTWAAPVKVDKAPAPKTVAPEKSAGPRDEGQKGLQNGSDAADRPWARGVSDEKQKNALELFKLGNAALRESLWVKAAQQYREALTQWDHPAIHYNLALALVNLDQPVETHEHLVAALKYGAAPLDSDKFDQANRYKALVEKQLARVDVRCSVEGAVVKLDGRELFIAPGRYEGLERAGPHTVVASKEGFLTNEQSRSLPPGEVSQFDLKLMTTEQLTEYRRLWPAWVPWVVFGSGAVVAGAGAGLHLLSRNDYASYDRGITSCVRPETGGCVPTADLQATKARADGLQTGAYMAYGLGGAAVITGSVLLYVNRLQPYTTSLEAKAPEVTILPLLAPGTAGAALSMSF